MHSAGCVSCCTFSSLNTAKNFHLLLVEHREELLRLVHRHGDPRHAERVRVELRARRRDHVLQLLHVRVRHLRLGEVDDVVALEGGLPRDARLGDDLEVFERDLAFRARPRGGRCELLEVGDGLDGALAQGLGLVVEVVVEIEVVYGDVEDLLQRLVELRLLLVDVGADLPAQRLLGVGDALLLRIERGAVVVEGLLELAAFRRFAELDDAFHLGEERVVVED